jgi:hypothetical protein
MGSRARLNNGTSIGIFEIQLRTQGRRDNASPILLQEIPGLVGLYPAMIEMHQDCLP